MLIQVNTVSSKTHADEIGLHRCSIFFDRRQNDIFHSNDITTSRRYVERRLSPKAPAHMEAREARCRRRGFYDQQSVRPTTLALEAKKDLWAKYGRQTLDSRQKGCHSTRQNL